VGFDGIERQFLSDAKLEREAAVIFGRVGAHERGGGGAMVRGAERFAIRHSAIARLAADFAVRGKILPRQHVERGKKLGLARAGVGDQQIEKCSGQFRERFRALIAVGDDQQRTFGRLPEQDQVQGLGGGQAGERKRPRLARRSLPVSS